MLAVPSGLAITRPPKSSTPKRKSTKSILKRALTVRSIQKDSSNPSLYTNRAFSRIKLQAWDSCIDDCLKAIELQKENMKGWYYLAQAQIALHHPNEAYHSAIKAYEICLKTHDSSATNISTLILQAKKEKWEAKERDRIRRRSELLRDLEDALEEKAASQIQDVRSRMDHMELNATEGKEEIDEIQHSSRLKIEELRNMFAISDPENLKRRVCNSSAKNASFHTILNSTNRRFQTIS
jgi:STIP1 family protein 1